MAPEILKCPMCGASASTDATRCQHCGVRLATIACPSCFGMMFKGAKFCSHCGARADRKERNPDIPRPCPRCTRVNLKPITIGDIHLCECTRCEGLWTDAESVHAICTDREKQAAVLGAAQPVPLDPAQPLEKIRYMPCPECKQLMHRINFANCSAVVVDVCKAHGTWFDKDELRRIVEFIRHGGLERSRQKQIQDLEERQRQLKATQMASRDYLSAPGSRYHDSAIGITLASAMLDAFLD